MTLLSRGTGHDASENYDARFYAYINEGSARSAAIVVDRLFSMWPVTIRTVLDVGCGAGAWLNAFRERDCDVLGVDGAHVLPDSLVISASEFVRHDIGEPLLLDRRFDLVLCLEVGEHLPAAAAPVLVASLCRHGDAVLFSAAPPGQGGAAHVNEQPYGYWQALFAHHGYRMYDPLRGVLRGDRRVSYWYRYNMFLFISEAAIPEAHFALAAYGVNAGSPPRDIAPLVVRWRRLILRLLPVGVVTWLANARKNLATRRGRR